MTTRSVGRIVWKEMRVQRGFLVAVIVLGAIVQMIPPSIHALHGTLSGSNVGNPGLWIAFVMATCFAIGSTAITFAGEAESGTRLLLQLLPVRWTVVLMGKLALALIGALVVFAVLATTALATTFCLGGAPHDLLRHVPDTFGDVLRAWFVPSYVFVASVLLISLVLKDVLRAALLGCVVAVALLAFANQQASMRDTLLFAFTIIVTAFDLVLARTWLRGASLSPLSRRLPTIDWPQRTLRTGTLQTAPLTKAVRSPVAWRRSFSSQAWKEWRQARSLAITLVVVILVSSAGTLLENGPVRNALTGVEIAFTALLPLVFGLAAFGVDRTDRAYRLFVHHGVSPDGYWLVKHLVWFSLTIGITAFCVLTHKTLLSISPATTAGTTGWDVAAFAIYAPTASAEAVHQTTVPLALVLISHCLLVYSIAQLWGLLLRSTITAAIAALATWAFVVVVAKTASASGEVWPTAAICVLVFWLTSWLYVGDWLFDRKWRRSWHKILAVVLIGRLALGHLLPLW